MDSHSMSGSTSASAGTGEQRREASEQTSQPSNGTSLESGGDMRELSNNQLYELTWDMMDKEASKRPLMSERIPILALRDEYERGSGTFVKQIDFLQEHSFTYLRRTRGDGDCFYRSLAFAWIERLMDCRNPTVEVAKALSLLDSSLAVLKAAGFQELVYEDFYDVLISLIRQIVVPEPDGNTLTKSVLLEAFQDAEVSNFIVVFLRLLTSATIRSEAIAYAPFLFDPETGSDIMPQQFCERFVEACGKEADHVQIAALTKALKLNIQVAYLDGRSDEVNFVDFKSVPPEPNENVPVLLYRPGHYDILDRAADVVV